MSSKGHDFASTEPVVCLYTIDTEPDNAWSDFRSSGLRNIYELPAYHELLLDLGARPTYLITYSVVMDGQAAAVLDQMLRMGPCEIGSHLHAWETPPFLPSGHDQQYQVFAQDLPSDHVGKKLAVLTDSIRERFEKPTAYRAGRWGFAPEHVQILESLGYIVDTSITPLTDRRGKYGLPQVMGGRGGRDYRRAPLRPYHPDYTNDLRPGRARLLEVPATVMSTRRASPALIALHRYGPCLLQKVMRRAGISSVVPASLPQTNWNDLKQMLRAAVCSDCPVINFVLHSSETMMGGAPWIRNKCDVNGLWQRTREAVAWLNEHGPVRFLTLSEFAREWLQNESRALAVEVSR